MAQNLSQIMTHIVRNIKPVFRNAIIAKIFGEQMKDLVGGVASVEFSVGAEDTNVIIVGCQAKDVLGNDCAETVSFKVLICADAAGAAFTDEDFTIAAGTDGALVEVVADKVLEVVTESDGDADISLTNTGASTVYLLAVGPTGKIIGTSAVVTHAA